MAPWQARAKTAEDAQAAIENYKDCTCAAFGGGEKGEEEEMEKRKRGGKKALTCPGTLCRESPHHQAGRLRMVRRCLTEVPPEDVRSLSPVQAMSNLAVSPVQSVDGNRSERTPLVCRLRRVAPRYRRLAIEAEEINQRLLGWRAR